jgi:hypothetical protein
MPNQDDAFANEPTGTLARIGGARGFPIRSGRGTGKCVRQRIALRHRLEVAIVTRTGFPVSGWYDYMNLDRVEDYLAKAKQRLRAA